MDSEVAASVESSEIETPFPTAVRVLIVDGNYTCLAVMEKMLRARKYEVVVVERARDAMSIICEKGNEIDLVLTDIYLPDMDGRDFLEDIDQQFNLPVVIVSADNNEELMVECLYKGAQMYLEKPITMYMVKILWQFTVTKKINETVAAEEVENIWVGSPPPPENDEEQSYKRSKRMEQQGSEVDKNHQTIQMNPKLVWTDTLHGRFLEAVKEIGLDNALPKQILEYMNVPGLTKEYISSDLQAINYGASSYSNTSKCEYGHWTQPFNQLYGSITDTNFVEIRTIENHQLIESGDMGNSKKEVILEGNTALYTVGGSSVVSENYGRTLSTNSILEHLGYAPPPPSPLQEQKEHAILEGERGEADELFDMTKGPSHLFRKENYGCPSW